MSCNQTNFRFPEFVYFSGENAFAVVEEAVNELSKEHEKELETVKKVTFLTSTIKVFGIIIRFRRKCFKHTKTVMIQCVRLIQLNNVRIKNIATRKAVKIIF